MAWKKGDRQELKEIQNILPLPFQDELLGKKNSLECYAKRWERRASPISMSPRCVQAPGCEKTVPKIGEEGNS